ncbi:platelet-activating factor acetylhydrolase 2, cytoplasmic-like [Tachypleus tridentatus]|uniref:platelet-activating factor acetylhydrolase 2, cytoplasmic-like n=1 Tax=Tachypleus tridentatus TaxID=6853 RepID=UPI003FD5DB14
MQKERKFFKFKLRHDGRWHIPLPSGPFTVGCTDIMTSYSKSGIFVRLFYPAAQSGILERSSQWPLMIPHPLYFEGIADFLGFPPSVIHFVNRCFIGNVYCPALWNAAPMTESHKFPVVVFSHGLGCFRSSYSTICLELASNGYIVAAVEHRDYSACLSSYVIRETRSNFGDTPDVKGNDNEDGNYKQIENLVKETNDFEVHSAVTEVDFEDVRPELKYLGIQNQYLGIPDTSRKWVYYRQLKRSANEYKVRHNQTKLRAYDCIQVLDLLEALNSGFPVHNVINPSFQASQFKGIMDLSKAAVAGHSFGGTTVILSLALDLRFKVGLALDSWMFPLQKNQEIFTKVTQPILFINMEKFQTIENLKVMKNLESKKVDRKVITVKGAVHMNQIDIVFGLGPVLRMCIGAYSRVNRFTVIDLTTRHMLVFLSKHFGTPVSQEHETYVKRTKKKIKEGIVFKKSQLI